MKDPNGKPTDDELNDLSKELIYRWQSLGIRLGVDQSYINGILRNDQNFPTHDLKTHAMLLEWQNRGTSFTYGKLAEALQKENLGRLAKQFCSSQVNN